VIPDVAGAAVLGVVLGVVTGLPIGVINVAIVEAATRGERRFAIQIGLGGALADAVHAAIAFLGIGGVADHVPQRALAVVAASVVIGYAVLALRGQVGAAARPRRYGVATGLALTLPNPAALGAWLAVAAALWPSIEVVPAIVLAAGVGIGSALWFTVLARVVAALPADHRIVRWLPRVAVALLAAIAVAGIVRAFAT
jgi:threonine/homoserine/homoserine lactone efflux protein